MPNSRKRTRSRSCSEDFESFAKKLKRFMESMEEERPSRRRIRRVIETSSSSSSSSSRETSPTPNNQQDGEPSTSQNVEGDDPPQTTLADIMGAGTSSSAEAAEQSVPLQNETELQSEEILDDAVLQILGDDPTSTIEYGSEIHTEVASKFEHVTTEGLTKEARKELCEKYLVPSNCARIGAPKLNAEIKAAMNENLIKCDKAIEARQKQIASAISCIAQIANDQLKSKDTNYDVLKKAMDAGRLLADVQHAESVTRRNFATYALKKEIKGHLVGTKIDKLLFGESLSDTIKTAKAVTKTGTDLKVDNKKKNRPTTTTQKPGAAAAPRNLNWKTPAPARRQPETSRRREPAAPRNQRDTSSKQSSTSTRRR